MPQSEMSNLPINFWHDIIEMAKMTAFWVVVMVLLMAVIARVCK